MHGTPLSVQGNILFSYQPFKYGTSMAGMVPYATLLIAFVSLVGMVMLIQLYLLMERREGGLYMDK